MTTRVSTNLIEDQAVTLDKLARDGSAGQVLTSNGSSASPSYQDPVVFSLPTGFVGAMSGDTAPTGWVVLSGRSIGNASSSATERANADCEALFVHLWTKFGDTQCPVSGGRGASAAADFAANKRITLPDGRGRVLAFLDNTGSAANRLTGTTMTPDGNTPGAVGGAQTHLLTSGEMPTHSHGYNQSNLVTDGTGPLAIGGTDRNVTPTSADTGSAGSGNAHNNVQPTLLIGVAIIKL